MKKKLILLFLLFSFSIFFIMFFSTRNERAIRKTVEKQFNQIKEYDQEALQANFEDPQVADILSLFHKNFSFQIKKISAQSESATVTIKLKTIDAKKLAKDFAKLTLEERFQHHTDDTQTTDFTLEKSYSILKNLITSQNYKSKSSNLKIKLVKHKDHWELVHTKALDHALIGNFFEHVSDPYLLTPKDIVTVYFNAIKNFPQEDFIHYLYLNDLLSSDLKEKEELLTAIAEQISNLFDYTISKEHIDGKHAIVHTTITGIDFPGILNSYKEELSKWLKTSEALSCGTTGRREKEKDLLLTCIKNNQNTISSPSEIHLTNDGINWKIEMSPHIVNAILGNIIS